MEIIGNKIHLERAKKRGTFPNFPITQLVYMKTPFHISNRCGNPQFQLFLAIAPYLQLTRCKQEETRRVCNRKSQGADRRWNLSGICTDVAAGNPEKERTFSETIGINYSKF